MDREQLIGTEMMAREAELPTARATERREQDLQFGLESAASINDRTIPLFNRSRPRYSSSGTFLGVAVPGGYARPW